MIDRRDFSTSVTAAGMTALMASTTARAASPEVRAIKPAPVAARNVVLVHGLFADGSSWSEVIAPLQARPKRLPASCRQIIAPMPMPPERASATLLPGQDRISGRRRSRAAGGDAKQRDPWRHHRHSRGRLSGRYLGIIAKMSGSEAEPAIRLHQVSVEISGGKTARLRGGKFAAAPTFMTSDTPSFFAPKGHPCCSVTWRAEARHPSLVPGLRFTLQRARVADIRWPWAHWLRIAGVDRRLAGAR